MRELACFLLVALSSTLAAGCGCTEVGCTGDLTIHIVSADASLHDQLPVTVKACADKTCSKVTLSLDAQGMLTCKRVSGTQHCDVTPTGEVTILIDTGEDDPSTGSIEIKNSGGDTLFTDAIDVDTTGYSPNGAFCGPTCYTGDAVFTPVSK